MLSNPHWDAPSFSSFEAWLETKDPNETYLYSNSENCACAQYLKHVGKYDAKWLAHAKTGDTVWQMNRLASDTEMPVTTWAFGSYTQSYVQMADYRFGKLLERVRKYRELTYA